MPKRILQGVVVSDKQEIRDVFEGSSSFFGTLGYASEVNVQADKTGIGEDAVSAVIHNAVIYIPFAELVDIDKELERLGKEKARLEAEIERGEKMLSNPGFVERAPEAKVNAERGKLAKYKETYSQVCERISALK